MGKVPEPRVEYRSWNYVYDRPRQMGWPNLAMTDLPGRDGGIARKGSPIGPRKILVHVRQRDGGEPLLAHISVAGDWAATRQRMDGWKRILHDTPPGQALQVYAPDWVLELAEDAVARATAEVKGEEAA